MDSHTLKRLLVAALGGAAMAACWIGGPATGLGAGDGGASGDGGVPCDAVNLLTKYCASCHGASAPSSGTSLVSYADLSAPSKSVPSKSEAVLSLERMQDGTMPPAGSGPGAAEIAAFEAWVSGGLQQTGCDNPAPDPFAGPHVCTSNSTYASGKGSAMEPGKACIACHKQKGVYDALYTFAGTVYPTAHEPDRCYGSGAKGAVVVLTDANGKTVSYTVNAAGNFAGTATLALPYTAEVQYLGSSRAMVTPQASGDCNVCHTENGANAAPGRILLP